MIHSAFRPTIRIPPLSAFLKSHGEAVVRWRRRSSRGRVCEMAARKGLPWLLLEDCLLRSVEREGAPLSLVVDGLGINYDASATYAFFRTSWVPLLRHLNVLSACEPIIYSPRSGSD